MPAATGRDDLSLPAPTGPGGALSRSVSGGFRVMEWLVAICLAVMVALVFTNVVLRYVFGSGIAAGEEFARLAFVWLIFLGAVLAMRERGHIGVTILVERLPARAQRALLLISHALLLYALWLLGQGSWSLTLIGLENHLPVSGLPEAVFSVSGVVLAIAMGGIILADAWRVLTGRNHDTALTESSPYSKGGE